MAIKISGSTIIDDDRNIVNAGVITATSFSGDGSGFTGVGIGTEGSINTSGIVTAYAVYAEQFEGFGDELIFSPTITSFSPTDGATDIALDTNIVLTFDQPIYAGVGSIFLRDSSATGTEIEAIGITSSMITNQTLTINPSSDLPIITDVYVVLPQGVVTNSVGGNIASVSTYNFTTIDFQLNSISPTNGATGVSVGTNITLSFSNAPTRGTGTVYLRSGSAGGTLIESFDAATSGNITISTNDWILNPSSNLTYSDTVYTVIPSTAINNYVGLNTTGASSHSFTTEGLPALGSAFEGGYLICTSGGTAWVVSPYSSEVSRDWYSRGDAVTRAQQVSGCTGWFVPNTSVLSNPGSTCRSYWDGYTATGQYWSTTTNHSQLASYVRINHGGIYQNIKTQTRCVRAFKCVTY